MVRKDPTSGRTWCSPFWTIPLLAIAGLHMRQIMGYTFVIFFVTFFLFGGGILLAGAG